MDDAEGGRRATVGNDAMADVEGVTTADLPTRVFDDLVGLILAGALRPGDLLASERALTEHHGVNRQVVREAVKRLAQLGLVTASRGNGTRVLDWRQTGSFDLLPLLVTRALRGQGPDPLVTARHLLEFRLSFALSVSELCVRHADDEQMDRLVRAAAAVASEREVSQRFAAEWAAWSVAAEGSGNVAMILMLNSLRSLAGPGLLLMIRASHTVPGDPEQLVVAAEAIAARDLPSATASVRHLYRIDPTPELRQAMAKSEVGHTGG